MATCWVADAKAQPSTCYPTNELQGLLPSPLSYGAYFGTDVAADGDVLAVGSALDKVYVFRRDGTTWFLEAELRPPDNISGSGFGGAVSVSGDQILVGAPVFGKGEGAVFLFKQQNGQWQPAAANPIQPTYPMPDAHFGRSVAISGQRFIVGAPGYIYEDTVSARTTTGLAFLFAYYSNLGWQGAELVPANTDWGDTSYGYSVAMEGDLIAVGAPRTLNNQGMVAMWEFLSSNFTLTKRLYAPDGQQGDQFGFSVDVHGSEVVIGAPNHTANFTGGAVYHYERDASRADVYALLGKIQPDPYLHGGYAFGVGADVALEGDILLMGAPRSGMKEEGAVYMMERKSGSKFYDHATYTAGTGHRECELTHFGEAVAASGLSGFAGAPEFLWWTQPGQAYFRPGRVSVLDTTPSAPKRGVSATPAEEEVAEEFVVMSNYPNPFNPATTIQYHLSLSAHVELTVYNAQGRRVATLIDGPQEAGVHTRRFDASALPGGLYLARLHAGEQADTRHMILVK